MPARYLRSQTTGVVLPYNDKLLKRPNVELMPPGECAEYEASLKPRAVSTVVETAPVVVPTPQPEVVVPTPAIETLPDEDEIVVEQSTVEVSDISDGEPDAAELLAALEVD